MAITHHVPTRCALAAALFASAFATQAQGTETITITGTAERLPAFAGFPGQTDARTPLQAQSWNAERLADENVTRLGDITRLDAGVSEAYDATGYWAGLSVRGYTLDNRFNVRREGLPVSGETAFALENKEAVELLKGASGMQAGTSAPGGLVNLRVKRPVAGKRSATVWWEGSSTTGAAVDLGDRSGPDGAFGWRVNAAYEDMEPRLHDTDGHRRLLAVALDWQLNPGSLVEFEIEHSRQQQPSAAGYSLRGNTVPDAHDINLLTNLNHQPWNGPVEMEGTTASLRWRQRLAEDWQLRAQAMVQKLRTDDRTAFPYGVYDANYECADWCDRFAPDGSFTYWQYVSLNERRDSTALELAASGTARTGAVEHAIEFGALRSRYRGRFEDQIFDIAGTGKDDGSLVSPPSAGYPDANTNRDETSTEFFLRDAMTLPGGWSLWAGLRHTRLARESWRTSADSDGSLRATDYDQAVTTPWMALAWQWTAATMVYASWGRGVESAVVPNRPRYANAGQALPALKSRQREIGLKHAGASVDASLALFQIERPRTGELNAGCDGDVDDSCRLGVVGEQRHRGVEASVVWRTGAVDWRASAMLLDAVRHESGSGDGLRPENVPARTLRLGADWRVAGLLLQADLRAEGDRVVLPYDDSVRIPGWASLDLGARWTQALAGGRSITWRTGVDNVFDRKAWKESPYQFDHVYLYPLQSRTWRASASLKF
ncbi:TonB-dependent siderophore receptor [Rubrivivax gelatinosus]|uniref:Iron complex outermembrane receptor protein n=1 Tax=Rubrivivax gelatinosus TaxID=28068 RepID=A0A4R2M9U3_RUBGE|nr:TonB-dependent siderophore receptor [Rubrivivax gelatinosus]MBK1687964.1 TonB-dependent siderophore receptor [Rubrivivax gelatinosus]TCO99245.1 iron complex outermembrane receptor protein [Rubrivivax gelatinosus]